MYKIYEIKEKISSANDKEAGILRDDLKSKGISFINLMSSPGSGKTTFLCQFVNRLKEDYKIGIMEADIDGDCDAATISKLGVKTIQLHTGGMCHLDADMSAQGLKELGTDDLDLIILENVGNLVCPAEFDTGAHKNLMILSVPEGDDKPLKYPLMFQTCDYLLINKIDVMEYFDFDMDRLKSNLKNINPKMKVFPISAKSGEGIDEFVETIKREI